MRHSLYRVSRKTLALRVCRQADLQHGDFSPCSGSWECWKGPRGCRVPWGLSAVCAGSGGAQLQQVCSQRVWHHGSGAGLVANTDTAGCIGFMSIVEAVTNAEQITGFSPAREAGGPTSRGTHVAPKALFVLASHREQILHGGGVVVTSSAQGMWGWGVQGPYCVLVAVGGWRTRTCMGTRSPLRDTRLVHRAPSVVLMEMGWRGWEISDGQWGLNPSHGVTGLCFVLCLPVKSCSGVSSLRHTRIKMPE